MTSGGPKALGTRLQRWLWGGVVLLLLIWMARTLVGDLYRVDSASMLPTLGGAGGEVVLVTYDRSPPERFELVVLYRESAAVPEVKRVVGLPRESVRLRHGDLWIDGQRLVATDAYPAWIPIFDSRSDVADHFTMELAGSVPGATGPWSREGEVWRLRALNLARGSGHGLMRHHKGLHDGYIDRAGRMVLGRGEAGDGRLRVRAAVQEVAEQGGRLHLGLLKAGDTFELVLDLTCNASGGLTADVRITQRWTTEKTLSMTTIQFELGEDLELSLSFRNGFLRGGVRKASGEEVLLSTTVEEEHEHPLTLRGEASGGQRTFGAHPWLGGEGIEATFKEIRVDRDLAWTSRGTVGVAGPVLLGPDEIFVLGDNSAVSRDSREWGAVPLSAVMGRPRAVLWPPRALRSLP
jgi:signal peptidase I